MGLNMNYRFFLESYKSDCHISEHKKSNNSIYSEEKLLEDTLTFNNTLRESAHNIISISESELGKEQYNSICNSLDSAYKAIEGVKDSLIHTIEVVRKDVDNVEFIDRSIERNFGIADRVQFLRKSMIYADSSELAIPHITDITPSKEILDKNYPNINAIANILKGSSVRINDSGEEITNNSFANVKDDVMYQLLGSWYDPSRAASIMQYAVQTADDTMPNKKYDQKLLIPTYLRACSNLDSYKEISIDLNEIEDSVKKNFGKCLHTIDIYREDLKNNSTGEYNKESGRVVYDMLNMVQNIICAVNIIATRKINRIGEIFGANGDSIVVVNTAHNLILKYIDLIRHDAVEDKINAVKDLQEKPADSIIFNGANEVQEFYDIQKENSIFNILIENAYNEYMYDDMLEKVLQEADGSGDQSNTSSTQSAPINNNATNNQQSSTQNNTQQNNSQNQQQQNNQQSNNNQNNNQNNANKNKTNILNWLKKLIGDLGNSVNKFKLRFDEVVTKGPDKKFWDANKEKLKKIDMSDTVVNQWYQYKFDLFKKSTVIKFDITSDSLKSDDSMKKAILASIDPNLANAVANKDDKETFVQKINKAYQGEYINEQNNSNGKTLEAIKYNFDDAYNFVDNFVSKGFGSDALGNATNDYQAIDDDYKNTLNHYDELANQLKQQSSNSQTQTTTAQNAEPAKNANGQTAGNNGGTTESAFSDFGSSTFNLAECLGLMNCGNIINEADINPGQKTAQTADNVNGVSGNTDELDKMIRRCFSMNVSALTAKLTNAMAAYKQNMSLFKSVINASESKNNKKEENKK